ncbi:hypothetical protein HY572_04670 [Candidatus Micrarchaeota archaeon]|nr:hypothetical protein [Candidatus Micrarchaeota archaeon]
MMMEKRRMALWIALLVLLTPLAFGFTVTSVTTSGPSASVTTGTDSTIPAVVTGDQSGNVNQITLTGTGRTTGTALTITDPASGSFTGTSITTSGTTVNFVVSAGVADTYDYSVTATYASGSTSSTTAALTVVAPTSLSVTGSVNSSNNVVGDRVALSVTLSNPSATQSVTSSYALTFLDASTFTVVSGDSTSGTITLAPLGTYTFNYVLSAATATSGTQIRFGLGSNTAAFSQAMTTSAPASSGAPAPAGSGTTATPTPSASASAAPTSAPPLLPAPAPKTKTATGEEVVASDSRSIGSSTAVTGSFGTSSATFEIVYQAPESGFVGDLTYAIPLDYDDYQAGLVTFDPEPSLVVPGSIKATWPVSLGSNQQFTAVVDVAKAVSNSVLDDFKAPSLAPKSTSTPRPLASSEAPASTPAPVATGTDATLWYVLGALVLLGAGYFLLMGGKKK